MTLKVFVTFLETLHYSITFHAIPNPTALLDQDRPLGVLDLVEVLNKFFNSRTLRINQCLRHILLPISLELNLPSTRFLPRPRLSGLGEVWCSNCRDITHSFMHFELIFMLHVLLLKSQLIVVDLSESHWRLSNPSFELLTGHDGLRAIVVGRSVDLDVIFYRTPSLISRMWIRHETSASRRRLRHHDLHVMTHIPI